MPPNRVPVQQTGSVPDHEERQDQQLIRYISSFQGLTDHNQMYSQYYTLQISRTFLAASQPFAQYRPYWGDESEPQKELEGKDFILTAIG
ncbi:hypothetical protein N7540_013215 [Penicillium herquei]|nr:hypothetical protein N7540_013215 [Penicillium herquei]